MAIYASVLGFVAICCAFAENADYPENDLLDSSRIIHTSNTLILYCIAGCVLILVAGLRYRVGADYLAYYYGYDDSIKNLSTSIRSLNEPGFGILSFLVTMFIDDGGAVLFAASFITIGLFLVGIYRHTDELLLSTILLIAMGCWHGSFNGVRQFLAIAIVFSGYKYLFERDFLNYAVVVLVATMFHRSAIVMIVLYFVVNLKINFKNVLIIILVSGVLLFSFERVLLLANFIMDKEYNPLGGYTSHRVNRLRVIASCLPAIVFLFEYFDVVKSKRETFFLNLTIINASICVLTMNSALLYRIGAYFTPFMVIAIPELLKDVADNNRKVLTGGFLGMYLAMWWYELSISPLLNHFLFIWDR